MKQLATKATVLTGLAAGTVLAAAIALIYVKLDSSAPLDLAALIRPFPGIGLL